MCISYPRFKFGTAVVAKGAVICHFVRGDAHLTTRTAQLKMWCDAVCTLPTVCTAASPTFMEVKWECRPRFCSQNSVLSTGHSLTGTRRH